MTDKELFFNFLDTLCERYSLRKHFPYSDDYFELISKTGKLVCIMEYRENNGLLHCLANLTSQLSRKLED